jgi:hypothetical protein
MKIGNEEWSNVIAISIDLTEICNIIAIVLYVLEEEWEFAKKIKQEMLCAYRGY